MFFLNRPSLLGTRIITRSLYAWVWGLSQGAPLPWSEEAHEAVQALALGNVPCSSSSSSLDCQIASYKQSFLWTLDDVGLFMFCLSGNSLCIAKQLSFPLPYLTNSGCQALFHKWDRWLPQRNQAGAGSWEAHFKRAVHSVIRLWLVKAAKKRKAVRDVMSKRDGKGNRGKARQKASIHIRKERRVGRDSRQCHLVRIVFISGVQCDISST